jgi:hypothetical protein
MEVTCETAELRPHSKAKTIAVHRLSLTFEKDDAGLSRDIVPWSHNQDPWPADVGFPLLLVACHV